MKKLLTLATLGVIAFANLAYAQKYDGSWKGTVDKWGVNLVVTGTTGVLTLSCANSGGSYKFDVPVSAQGAIDTFVKSQGFARRRISGQLPSLTVEHCG